MGSKTSKDSSKGESINNNNNNYQNENDYNENTNISLKMDSISTVSMAVSSNDPHQQQKSNKSPTPPIPPQRHVQILTNSMLINGFSNNEQPQPRPSSSPHLHRTIPDRVVTSNNNPHHKPPKTHFTKVPDQMALNIDGDGYSLANSMHAASELFGPQSATLPAKIKTNDNGEEKKEHKSGYILIVFIFDILLILLVAILAFLLRYTDDLKVVEVNPSRSPVCNEHTKYLYSYPNGSQLIHGGPSLWFDKMSKIYVYFITLILPIIMILFIEMIRLVIKEVWQTVDDREKDAENTIVVPKTRCKFPISFRRLLRFISAFILGYMCTSVLVDILKLQTGEYRPYTLSICPDLCSNITADCVKSKEMMEARKSFPSMTSSLASYSCVFLWFYVTANLQYRPLRVVRMMIIMVTTIVYMLMSYSQITSHNNHPSDVYIGWLIGTMVAWYICFFYLNSFANVLSTTNFFSSKYGGSLKSMIKKDDDATRRDNWFWKSFRIPRVQHFTRSTGVGDPSVSRNASIIRNDRPILKIPRSTNAYINPAFDDERIVNTTNNRRHMRTFQN